MRVIVCFVLAALVSCSLASDAENKLLEALEGLEETVKGLKSDALPDDVQAVLQWIPSRLRSRVAAYIPKRGRKRFLKCARAVGSVKEPAQLDDAAKRAPHAVEEAVMKLPETSRNGLIGYDKAMRNVIDVLLVCSKPKGLRKGKGKGRKGKGKEKNPDMMDYRRQANATAEILMTIAHAPSNVAWKLLLYVTSVPAAARVEMLECGKKAHAAVAAHISPEVAEPESAKVMADVAKLDSAAQAAIVGYGTSLWYIVNNLLECTTAGR